MGLESSPPRKQHGSNFLVIFPSFLGKPRTGAKMKRTILLLLQFLPTVVVGLRRSEADVLRSRRRMLIDPRRWREGERSLGEGVLRTPVLARGVTYKKGDGSSDLESLKLKAEKAEEQTPLDNLFFTFCCGDNLTCLKNNMVCDGSIDCPNGEDEVQCETESKAEEEQLKKKGEKFSFDLVSIHTKVAKETQARLKEEAKVVMIDGRRAKVKRRRRLRKEFESDEKEEVMTEVDTGRREGVLTKVRRRKKVRKETNKELSEEETDNERRESNFKEPKDDEIKIDVATEIPQFWDGDTLSMTTDKSKSETEEPMNEGITELSTEKADNIGFERREGGRVLLVGGRKVRVNKRRRQKAPAVKSLPVLSSSSDSDDSSRSFPSSSSNQLYSVEQLRQSLGQRPVQSQRQEANKDKVNISSDTESLVTTEIPVISLDTTPAAMSFQGTWIFDSFQASESKEKLPEAKMSKAFTNPPLPGPPLPPGFFASFDAQFV